MNIDGKLNYVEFHAKDIPATKAFFGQVFGWAFVDYGPDYVAFSDQGLDGGFFKSDLSSDADKGAALVIFFGADLEKTLAKVKAAGGKITREIFTFPGGRRFHFLDPNDNEFAVWSDKTTDGDVIGD